MLRSLLCVRPHVFSNTLNHRQMRVVMIAHYAYKMRDNADKHT